MQKCKNVQWTKLETNSWVIILNYNSNALFYLGTSKNIYSKTTVVATTLYQVAYLDKVHDTTFTQQMHCALIHHL